MSSTPDSRYRHACNLMAQAELIHDAAACDAALRHTAAAINRDFQHRCPLVLAVMGGAAVFAGRLLPLLDFPLDFDYIHISRYGKALHGGAFRWLREPQQVAGRDVLVLDDILDEGLTMAEIKSFILSAGAASCRCAVFANKAIGRDKPIQADYVGLSVPDRYVFGFGMDAAGLWRNLDAVYALAEQ